MAAVRKMSVFLVSFLSVFLAAQAAVPVIVWSKDTPLLEQYTSFGALSAKQFEDDYLERITSDGRNVVVFLQDKLSIDDITQEGDVYNENGDGGLFKNLKSMEEDHNMFPLPQVTDAVSSLLLLKETKRKVFDLVGDYDVRKLDLDDDSNLIFVHLPSTGASHEEFRKALTKIDEVIGSVSTLVAALGKPYTAIYTARKPTLQTTYDDLYVGRHLLASDDPAKDSNASFINVSSCLFLYAKNITLQLVKPAEGDAKQEILTYVLPALTEHGEGSSCSDGKIVSKYGNYPKGLTDFTFTMTFKNTTDGYWRMTGIQISYTTSDKGSGKDVLLKVGNWNVYGPRGFSYHCTTQPPFTAKNFTDSGYKPQLVFTSMQVQYEHIKKEKFGRFNDCEGFFSIPALSGLFVSLLLILVLSFGIYMISSINTMDRFDDPKGKTITVNIND